MPKIEIRLDPDQAFPAPSGVNFFHFTHVDSEVEMLAGYVDLTRIHHAVKANESAGEGGAVQVEPEVTHRFVMSLNGFFQLLDRVNNIGDRIRRQTESPESESSINDEGPSDG